MDREHERAARGATPPPGEWSAHLICANEECRVIRFNLTAGDPMTEGAGDSGATCPGCGRRGE